LTESNKDVRTIPDCKRRAAGPVVVIECFQKIPCDPCHEACNQGAIGAFDDINCLPEIDFEKCNGCGRCIPRCPGLAIFVVDETWKDDLALVKLPFEFIPLPCEGQRVYGLARNGVELCEAKVIRVENTKRHDRTPVVWVEVPRTLAMDVRHIRVGGTSLDEQED
jgi:Fe-S-cluster-containing hydrogenase component 2